MIKTVQLDTCKRPHMEKAAKSMLFPPGRITEKTAKVILVHGCKRAPFLVKLFRGV